MQAVHVHEVVVDLYVSDALVVCQRLEADCAEVG